MKADAARFRNEAEKLYLAGRQYLNQRTEQGFQKGLQLFERAIREDPGYLPAYSGVADSYILLGEYGLLEPREAYPRAKAAAMHAVARNELVPEPHASLAFVAFVYDWDWRSAETEYRRAIELNPSYATAHQWYAWYLMAMRRFPEALGEIRRARELDPQSAIIQTNVGSILYFARDYDQAIEICKQVLTLEPDFPVAHGFLGSAYAQKRLYKEAIQELEKGTELAEHSAPLVAALGHAFGSSGNTVAAQRMLGRLQDLARTRYVSMTLWALIHAGLGQKHLAFEALEKAGEERSSDLVLLPVDPNLDVLRSELRFGELMRRIGFPG